MNLNWLLYISLYFLEYSHTIYLFENQTLNLVYVTPLSLLTKDHFLFRIQFYIQCYVYYL